MNNGLVLALHFGVAAVDGNPDCGEKANTSVLEHTSAVNNNRDIRIFILAVGFEESKAGYLDSKSISVLVRTNHLCQFPVVNYRCLHTSWSRKVTEK